MKKKKDSCCPSDVVTWSSVKDAIGWMFIGLIFLGSIVALLHHSYYSGQLDGELEKVATEAYELTEAAREVLKGGDLTKGSRSRGCRKCSGHHQETTGINAW